MRWKRAELISEFARAHPHVQALALYLDKWFLRRTGHDGMVTDVSRTQEEYDELYGAHPYMGPMPHLVPMSHAVDWRAAEFLPEQIEEAVGHMNEWWPRKDGKPTLMCHAVGNGPLHLHLQVPIQAEV